MAAAHISEALSGRPGAERLDYIRKGLERLQRLLRSYRCEPVTRSGFETHENLCTRLRALMHRIAGVPSRGASDISAGLMEDFRSLERDVRRYLQTA